MFLVVNEICRYFLTTKFKYRSTIDKPPNRRKHENPHDKITDQSSGKQRCQSRHPRYNRSVTVPHNTSGPASIHRQIHADYRGDAKRPFSIPIGCCVQMAAYTHVNSILLYIVSLFTTQIYLPYQYITLKYLPYRFPLKMSLPRNKTVRT